MSKNINEIIKRAELVQKQKECKVNEDILSDFYRGQKCYNNRDFDGAEYWWEKAARTHDKKAKEALLKLYKKELKHKYDYSVLRIPVSAVRRTCGGNAPHYGWDDRVCFSR